MAHIDNEHYSSPIVTMTLLRRYIVVVKSYDIKINLSDNMYYLFLFSAVCAVHITFLLVFFFVDKNGWYCLLPLAFSQYWFCCRTRGLGSE